MMQTQTQPSRGLGVFTEPKTACTIWFKCLYIFLWKRKIHIRSCYLWAVKRWLFSLCHLFFFLSFPNLLQCIYIYIYLYIYAPYYQGKKCSLLPILYTLYHVQRHAFISITFTVLEVSSSILTGYMSKSQFQGLMVQFSGFSTSL